MVLIDAADTFYCEDCKAYYIEEAAFEGLKTLGRIMCAVFNRETFDEFVKNGRQFNKEPSIYFAYYTVCSFIRLITEGLPLEIIPAFISNQC